MQQKICWQKLPPSIVKGALSLRPGLLLPEHRLWPKYWSHSVEFYCLQQGGITCGAIDEPRKSSKAIDERVIKNFCDKNVVIARFHDL